MPRVTLVIFVVRRIGQENGALPLFEAVGCASADLVKAVLEAGCDINQSDVRELPS